MSTSEPTPIAPVRDATEGDLPALVDIYVRAYAEPPWNEENDPKASENYLRWVLQQPGTFCLVAEIPPVEAPSATAGSTGKSDVAGFVLAGERAYTDFVEDWERAADRPEAGWPVVEGTLGYIWEIAVRPSAQQRGLGATLMRETLARLKRDGVERVLLRSSERAAAAVALYRRFGFQRLPLRERRDPFAGPWVLDLT